MLSPTISTDARVRDLPCMGARLLFSWMIAHADNLGRMRGEPAYVRATVIPHEPGATDEDVSSWLRSMAELGLIDWYEVDGGRYVQFRAWARHQRLDRMKKSDLPPPPVSTGSPLVSSGDRSVSTGLHWSPEVEGEVEVEGEGEGEREAEHEGEGERGRGNGAMTSQRNTASREPNIPTPTASPHPAHCTCEVCWNVPRRA